MADSPFHRRDSLGAALLAVLLALSVVASGVGVAHGNTDHVVRNGDQIGITLGDEHFNGTDRNVTVRAAQGKLKTVSPDRTANGESTYTVSVTELAVSGTDLSNTSVTVEPPTENGTAVTERVNLRTLAFDGTARAAFSNGTLEVPLQYALGYTDGQRANVTLAGDGAPIADATVRNHSGGLMLAVELNPGSVHLPPSKGTMLAADRGNETELNLWQLTADETDVERRDDRTIGISSPLLVAGTEYDVLVTEPATNATYASSVTTDADGTLTVTGETLANAESLAVSVYRDGAAVFENVPHNRPDAGTLTANVTANGNAVNITESTLTAPANETTVWLANDTRYVQASAHVENGFVDLNDTEYRLNDNASYQLIVESGDEVVRAEVPGNESSPDFSDDSLVYAADGDQQGGDGGEDGSDGGSDEFLGGTTSLLVAGAALLGFLAIGVFGFFRWSGDDGGPTPDPDEVDSAAMASTHDAGHEVEFRVEDAATDSTVSAVLQARQTSHRTPGQNGEKTELPNGTGSMTLDPGRWVVQAGSHGVKSGEREVNPQRRRKPVEFTLGPKTVDVAVTDDDGEPVANAHVTCAPDQGRTLDDRTGGDGSVTFPVPLAADEVEVSTDPDGYDGDAATASVANGNDASAALDVRRETGDLDVTATVEGTPVAGLSVEVRPSGEDSSGSGADGRTATTDGDGVAGFADLPVGEYEVGMGVPGGGAAFSVESSRVRVRDDRTARASLDASFEFSLGRNQRDRIASIRQEVDELVSISGRDVAIQRYYGSVVTDLLETVERLPREGHRFARADADPDAVADAVLDAAESSVELVGDAMTTKRNADLFGACVDMTDHRVEWREGYDVDALFELLDADRKDQRQTVLTQLRAVDDRINDERSDLAVVAPARAVWDGVKAFVNEERGDDPVRGAAVAFAAGGLLDAVDELFDHEQLRERLQRTVF